ncbi:TetR/AcrR family transcriptional regulator; helix-turn-helix transcriptional regulator [Acetobacter sicerae]|uniref:TetR/AcrR family transcriptional regulator helix-turn-helix transcriptional regulator n=1 Tax=Acetobacter sicerae TaxID=85325 RepID=A0ABS8VY70_9PROT|nr:TetR/AcrR family transcriptional regulator [Acetobacter sicerae]MCE0744034.1 TetR/AcrR family transcriptional regulator; helix-turn-helix transcriptional regulator [Acetobacter sicerae]
MPDRDERKKISGRPDGRVSEELDILILKTASRLFGEQGYAATSVEQIAAVAQVGKQTIYRRHPSKESLFKTVISELGKSFLVAATPSDTMVSSDPLLTLRKTMRMLLDLVLSPETLSLSRTFIAEGWRFPDLVNHAGAHIFDPLEELTCRLMTAVSDVGLLKESCDLKETSRLFSGLCLEHPHQQMLFGRDVLMTAKERDDFLENAWTAFMTGILRAPVSRPATVKEV